MEEDWFAPEVPPEPTPQPPPARAKAPGTGPDAPAPVFPPALAANRTDEKYAEEKPEEWFSKPSTSTNDSKEEPNEDWFAKPPAKKGEASLKKNLPPKVTSSPPKIVPPKDLPAQMPSKAKEEDPANWFAKAPANPTDSKVKNQPRKEAYMYGYISKVITIQNRMRSIHPESFQNV